MTTRKLRLTKTEDQQHRARLLRLEQMGIPIGCADDASPEPDRLILEQIQHGFARIYELPSGAVAVVVPAKMTVLNAGILITDLEMTTGLDDYPLDLSDPTEWPYYQDVVAGLPCLPPTILNHQLTGALPLRPCRVEGVIFANGWSSVPPECHDETIVRMELFLWDERRNEICVDFGARVDRSLKRKYEWLRERREVAPLTKRRGLYEREGGQLGDQKSVSPEEAFKSWHDSGDDDTEL
jgi:hypothetical protein